MIAEQCISVTDLKKNANSYLQSLDKPRYVFVNNKPRAVLVDIDMYEKLNQGSQIQDFFFDPPLDPKDLLNEYKKAYGSKGH